MSEDNEPRITSEQTGDTLSELEERRETLLAFADVHRNEGKHNIAAQMEAQARGLEPHIKAAKLAIEEEPSTDNEVVEN